MERSFCGEHCNEHGLCHHCGYTAGVLVPADKLSHNHAGHAARILAHIERVTAAERLPVVVSPARPHVLQGA